MRGLRGSLYLFSAVSTTAASDRIADRARCKQVGGRISGRPLILLEPGDRGDRRCAGNVMTGISEPPPPPFRIHCAHTLARTATHAFHHTHTHARRCAPHTTLHAAPGTRTHLHLYCTLRLHALPHQLTDLCSLRRGATAPLLPHYTHTHTWPFTSPHHTARTHTAHLAHTPHTHTHLLLLLLFSLVTCILWQKWRGQILGRW